MARFPVVFRSLFFFFVLLQSQIHSDLEASFWMLAVFCSWTVYFESQSVFVKLGGLVVFFSRSCRNSGLMVCFHVFTVIGGLFRRDFRGILLPWITLFQSNDAVLLG